ncbi:hypothetical protein KRR40_12865 [Niabella defluvii]|nr:hypothetical protein KRR40_12865 [Niabella sp. I65]
MGKSGNNRITDDMWRYQYEISSSGGPGWGETNETGYEYYINTGGKPFLIPILNGKPRSHATSPLI